MLTGNEARKWIEESNGKDFSVRFYKRGTQTLREMACRTNVKDELKGGERAYEPEAYCLINVFDTEKKAYRCFPLDGLKEIKIDDKWESVVPPDVKHQQLLDDAMDKELGL